MPRIPFSWLAWPAFVVLIIIFILFQRNARRAAETTKTLDEISQRATQNILAMTSEYVSTATADAFAFAAPRTQTAVYITTIEPLTQTADANIKTATVEQALITPTITLTSVALPTQIIDSNNNLMALVPAGSFNMGWAEDPASQPTHEIYLPAFYMDMYEVSNAQYKNCADVGACEPPVDSSSQTHANYYGTFEYANYPVIHVTWQMARTYCEWRGARLPTEAEWEKAARGTELFMHPWGDEAGCIFANHNNCLGDTIETDKYLIGASQYAILNLSGNVTEWTSSAWMDYPYNADDGREDPASDLTRVLRGGSWASPPTDIFTFRRFNLDPTSSRNDIGFRCARSVGK